MRHAPAAALVAALSLAAGAAQAHAHLKGSTPAADSAGPAPRELTLSFTEGLEGRFSGLELAGPAGAVPVRTRASGSTMTATPAAPLAPGAYKVTWHAVATDTHRSQGSYGFTVK